MKKYIFLFIILAGCSAAEKKSRDVISLAGEWGFRIDSLDRGIKESWYNSPFSESVKLPGSMAENGKGDEVSVNTGWTGDIVDRSYFTDKKYEKYRQPGNIKIPFWLKPVKYYKGVAWYMRQVELPDQAENRRIVLFLERCHWQTTVFVNGENAGTRNGLSTPHEYDITSLLKKGRNKICIRVDNRIIIPIGVNSHSISDHTQTNWNGITGEISLHIMPDVYISDIRVYPDIKNNDAKVVVSIGKKDSVGFNGTIQCQAKLEAPGQRSKSDRESLNIVSVKSNDEFVITYHFRDKVDLWSEFTPSVYTMNVTLRSKDGSIIDRLSSHFGMREFKAAGTRFEVNGTPIFLRGTTECCVFPLTGYPPSDTASWAKIFRTCRDYGLNHVRFHSYCPPEAAFTAADHLGFYLHVECSSWANQGTSIGDGSSVDTFIYEESDRILEKYGNHPSFCMLAYGNEPDGKNQEKYLGDLIKYWKSKDNRRVYTSAAGWPIIPENDYHLTPEPRIQHWDEGLKSIINREPVQTLFDFRDFVSKYPIPVVSHEIGQWCVYPDFSEIEKYTGVLKPSNLEIFRETLGENHMGNQAGDFLKASGKLQVLCYKADIEAALRTPGFAGFQMLQLHDFPGQGTALVGILNPFFESKGYVTPEEFRMFCSQTVPLARIRKMVYRNNEDFVAEVEIANFGPVPLGKSEFICQVTDKKGVILRKEIFTKDKIDIGNCNLIGNFEMDLAQVKKPESLTFEISILGTPYRNQWKIWVYPAEVDLKPGNVIIADKLDHKIERYLEEGRSVLLLADRSIAKSKGADVAIGYSTIFWNTAWTGNQPPHTMGILCDPKHPVFKNFPTEAHTDAQWWDAVTNSQVMILNDFPAELVPLIQPVDTWFENRKLALAFEARVGKGRILICSIDLKNNIDGRPSTRQLASSILEYMNSSSFNPSVEVGIDKIKELLK
ncbi:MAG: sugar-binding domain-containing protein [Bacteroidales bacterium]|jgi:hypothetical protein